jgi:hypothetical protein
LNMGRAAAGNRRVAFSKNADTFIFVIPDQAFPAHKKRGAPLWLSELMTQNEMKIIRIDINHLHKTHLGSGGSSQSFFAAMASRSWPSASSSGTWTGRAPPAPPGGVGLEGAPREHHHIAGVAQSGDDLLQDARAAGAYSTSAAVTSKCRASRSRSSTAALSGSGSSCRPLRQPRRWLRGGGRSGFRCWLGGRYRRMRCAGPDVGGRLVMAPISKPQDI